MRKQRRQNHPGAPPALAPIRVGRTGDVFQFPQSERCGWTTLEDGETGHKGERLIEVDLVFDDVVKVGSFRCQHHLDA
jgi:hypothetical protein